MSDRTRRLVRDLAATRGLTSEVLVEEAVARGFGTRAEALTALRYPVWACPVFLTALEAILGLYEEEVDQVWNSLKRDAREVLEASRA